jgi:Polysulphide reductase, NrfD
VSQQEPNAGVTSAARRDSTRSASDRPGVNMVGRADFRSYYGRPVLKEPVWTWEIPWYFFLGGMAGASAPLAFAARLTGNHRLARAALTTGAASLAVSPVLLTADLGRPDRTHHMLRVFKPTSPMNLGSWLLAAISPALMGAAVADRLGTMPRLARTAEGVAAVLGPGLATYTAVLVADTAVPVWHEAGRELPFVFAGSAAASAGAAACLLTPPGDAGPARRLAVGAAAAELAAATVMERRLGELAEPYRLKPARHFARLAKGLSLTGALVLGLAGRRRLPAAVGGALLLAGSACQRHAVVHAGRLSARDPKYVVKPQRERLLQRHEEAQPSG